MKAIDFVVRDSAGGLQRGVVSADASTHSIQARTGQEISLNLRQTDLVGQVRAGNDLVITLSDGRVITIDNYFNDAGTANRLFISSDGYLNEVALADTGNGELSAQFGPTEQWGKWSPSDDLIYLGRTEVASVVADDEVSMFAAPLLGTGLLGGGAATAAAAAAGVGAIGVLGGGGGGDSGPAPAAPYVDDPDSVTDIGGDGSEPHVLTITGGGEPGDAVSVSVGGTTIETVIGEDGTFEVIFEGENFPPDGTYECICVVTTANGDVTLDGPGFVIDTTPPETEITSGAESTSDFFNAEGFEGGVTLAGTGEIGAQVEITISGITQSTVVGEDGTWSATWTDLTDGEYTAGLTLVATDAFGNSTTITDNVVIDTVADVTISTATVETDGIVNHEEREDGVTLTGTAQSESTVEVTFGTGTRTVSTDGDGNWTADFIADEIPSGETSATVTAVATDGVGNTSTVTEEVTIDTLVRDFAFTDTTGGADGVINAAEAAAGVTMTGTVEPGSAVDVALNGHTHAATVAADGTWSVRFAPEELPGGEQTIVMTAIATDAAGNTQTIAQDVPIDTAVSVTIDTGSVETDGIVNAVEREDGVTLTGTAQPGATVVVSFGTGSHAATVDANGNWGVDFPMSEVPTGEVTAPATAVATDAAGNTSTATGDVEIDTLVRDFGFTGSTGGADGVINIKEAAAGVTMTGTTEPGASVDVTMNGHTHAATVAANGAWTVQFAASELPTGEQTVVMTATATDPAGNVDSISRDVVVDRDAGYLTISATPVEGDDTVNAAEASDGVTLTGTSTPGAVVSVTMAGVAQTVVTDGTGNWAANFAPHEVAAGVYTADIRATTVDAAGNALEAIDSVEVDTRVENLSIDTGAVGGADGVINGAERLAGGGVRVTGTTEIGSTAVVVELGGQTANAVVDAVGNWTAIFSAAQLPEGTQNLAATVTATDRAGNTDSVSGSIAIDTEVVPFSLTQTGTGSDEIASSAEVATGIDLGGQVEAGSSVIVNFDGTDHAASVDAAGNWSLTIPPNAIRGGTYSAAIAVTATDAAGNSETITDTLAIDTDAPDGPVIASYTRDGDGIRGISTEISADDLAIHQVHANGNVTEVAGDQIDIASIQESNFQFDSKVPDGSHLVITATDDAGNTSGTYVVLDDEVVTEQVTLDANALGALNIERLDLTFAEEGKITITQDTLPALSANTNELRIDGGSDDTVNIAGAVRQGSAVRDGQSYDIYTLGSEGTLFIDDAINVVI